MRYVRMDIAAPVRSILLGVVALVAVTCGSSFTSAQAQPITTDSRIKTYVYNPNEVYILTTHYGYQSNIEFGPREIVETISVGDRVPWQIIPAGRRMFIRAMEENAHTNMTVITNQRAYQFDLRSSSADAVFGSAELTYVVRFYYPGDETQAGNPLASNATAPASPPQASMQTPLPAASSPPSQMPPAPAMRPAALPATAPASTATNYRYTYSGPTEFAPTKIYDDGKTTFFKMPPGQTARIAILTAKGETIDSPAITTADGLLAVNAVASRFKVSQQGRDVIVYNEARGEGR